MSTSMPWPPSSLLLELRRFTALSFRAEIKLDFGKLIKDLLVSSTEYLLSDNRKATSERQGSHCSRQE
jgi:hypothetical protein